MRSLLVALCVAVSGFFVTAQAATSRLDALRRLRGARLEGEVPARPSKLTRPGASRGFGSTKAQFHVDGGRLPLLNATLQDSYAGRIPIASNDTRRLFFWYWPSSGRGKHSDTLTIWLNGGPGCSSLTGFLTEHGAFTYRPGTDAPSVNEFAWSSVSDMLYVDQPISTGFSSGDPDIVDEIGVGNQFYGFLQQFYKVFPELLRKKLYIAGESYAGMYIPYIANRIVNASPAEKASTPINLQSILINNGLYSNGIFNEIAPMAGFVVARQNDIGIGDAAVQQIVDLVQSPECAALPNIMAQLVYPPKGPIYSDDTLPYYCQNVVLYAYSAALQANRCFNLYRITDKCPTPVDPIEEYFSRADVQEALNIPGFGPWEQCGARPFVGTDQSPYSDTILPSLIESLPRGVTLWHGVDDILLLANGTRLTIQNMTWAGLQGFRKPITQQLLFDGALSGVQHSERGLTYYEIEHAGHMIPEDQPKLALEVLKTVLGKGKGILIRS